MAGGSILPSHFEAPLPDFNVAWRAEWTKSSFKDVEDAWRCVVQKKAFEDFEDARRQGQHWTSGEEVGIASGRSAFRRMGDGDVTALETTTR